MSLPPAAVTHYRESQALTASVMRRLRSLWALMGEDFDLSWATIQARVAEVVAQGQAYAVMTSTEYASVVSEQVGMPAELAGPVNVAAFAGVTGGGEPVAAVARDAVIHAKVAVAGGVGVREALRAGGAWLEKFARNEITAARSDALSAFVAASPTTTGFVRMLNPPSCRNCLVLAGKWFRWNEGFQRHPGCLVPGASVSGPSAEAATRRWYEGEVVTLTTASGQEVTVTANHPVLTSGGWIPANLIQEGDDVVRSTRPEGATPLVVPDHQQVPALIEDVWGSFSVNGLHTVPTTAEDFHGDGGQGEVDVVYPDGSLFDGLKSAIDQHVKEHLFASGLGISEGLVRQGVSQLLDLGRAASAGGSVGGSGLSLSLRHGHLLVPDDSGFAHSADLDAAGGEYAADGSAGYPVLHGERVLGRSAFVGGDDFFSGEGERLARWDAPGGPFQLESRDGYASRGLDLLERLTGQVELDRVVKLSRVEWSGHVYNLTSSEGWFSANSLIVSNCDCTHVPARESAQEYRTDPYAYFRGMSPAEQDRMFGKRDAQAIRDGADIYRVVNVKQRGASERRGWAGRLYKSPTVTIEDILKQSRGDRTRALELMREHGFILPQGQVAGGALAGNAGGSPWGYSAGAMGRGGSRKGATAAYRKAVESGNRDILNPATQTAAERRFHQAYLRAEAMRAGRNPFSGSRPLTVLERQVIEKDWESQLAYVRSRNASGQVKAVADRLGVK